MIAAALVTLAAVIVGALIGVMSVIAAFAFARSLEEPECVHYVLDDDAVNEEFDGIAATWEDEDK